MLALENASAGRAGRLRARFVSAWARTDEIFGLLRAEAILSQPILWRHPFIFYVGHLPAFASNQIFASVLKQTPINPGYDDLFGRGIDPDIDTGACHAHPKVPQTWPEFDDVLRYRDRVRSAVLDCFGAVLERSAGDVMAENGRVLEMVLEHEYMHQETLLYMVQQLPLEIKRRAKNMPGYRFATEPAVRKIAIPAGSAQLGAEFRTLKFGWDNEFPALTADVPAFTIDSLPVTNGRFLEFVASGGYQKAVFWSASDWEWKQGAGVHHPNSWNRRDTEWYYRTIFDVVPLKDVLSWPVYVSLAEARAYARWRGKRLPTEAEFHRAAAGAPAYGAAGRIDQNAPLTLGNLDFISWAPVPAGSYQDQSSWGVGELIGNGWEWTDTPLQPFPGFNAYVDGYREYSSDFFDGKHFVLKGASWATAADLVRPSFRNWYQAHYPYVFAKFRCVSD
jgi:ergothioneine biosynthesis protein EgtB